MFSNTGNDIAIISNLPQHEDSTKNIDMGQRNQIRGQRERERERSCCLKKGSHSKLFASLAVYSFTVVHYSQHIKPAEAAVTYCIAWDQIFAKCMNSFKQICLATIVLNICYEKASIHLLEVSI